MSWKRLDESFTVEGFLRSYTGRSSCTINMNKIDISPSGQLRVKEKYMEITDEVLASVKKMNDDCEYKREKLLEFIFLSGEEDIDIYRHYPGQIKSIMREKGYQVDITLPSETAPKEYLIHVQMQKWGSLGCLTGPKFHGRSDDENTAIILCGLDVLHWEKEHNDK